MTERPAAVRAFECPVRVPYAHVDQMGFVYYAHYLVYFEMARSALLREAGLPYGEMEKRGILLPVVEARCVYRKPAHFDDLLLVRSRCALQGRSRLRIAYRVERDGELVAEGYTDHVCMTGDGRVVRPVPELRALAVPGRADVRGGCRWTSESSERRGS